MSGKSTLYKWDRSVGEKEWSKETNIRSQRWTSEKYSFLWSLNKSYKTGKIQEIQKKEAAWNGSNWNRVTYLSEQTQRKG